MKTLGELFLVDQSLANLQVTDIVDDSRKATKGSLFVAINGNSSNGTKFVQNAIDNGAKFIVYNQEKSSETIHEDNNVVYIPVPNARKELSRICSIFWPVNFQDIIAVTGTNGKSSTVDIVRQIWIHAGLKAASIGTLGIITKDSYIKSSLTSPGAITLHHILTNLQNNYIKHIAMEASSHGLDQFRVDHLGFSVCAFTNFTQDHLDYHKTFEHYWSAKERLFTELQGNCFVINSDDNQSFILEQLAKQRNIKYITYGKQSQHIKLIDVKEIDQCQKVFINFFGKEVEFDLPLAGTFQVYNSLCAMGICYATGISINVICKALKNLKPINGRLELVGQSRGANIYIDYAHTPDALKKALLSLRKHTNKKLLVLFGCGGDRDTDKRKLMGKVAHEFADITIVTDDNPRTEDPQVIRKMILEGCPTAKEFANRRKAIQFAIHLLSEGDILLIAGKGHEDYQILAGETIHFSDKEVILEVIK